MPVLWSRHERPWGVFSNFRSWMKLPSRGVEMRGTGACVRLFCVLDAGEMVASTSVDGF
jgi:hypothetical protein